MTDRRRINGPAGGTAPPLFQVSPQLLERPQRSRAPGQPRKIFLQTGFTPSASGSAYLELEASSANAPRSQNLLPATSTLKITCAVHGPRPLPRSAPFSSQLILSTNVKYAPFAARQRRGFVRDASERDLGVHLETALRGVIIGDRWPKSGLEVVITILEAEDDCWWVDEDANTGNADGVSNWGIMTVLAGCITAASAAIVTAGIDCVDLVSGGVAAVVRSSVEKPAEKGADSENESCIVLDPCPAEHNGIDAACVVAYLASRDEITELWSKGDLSKYSESLMDRAIEAAKASRTVLVEAVAESTLPLEPLPASNGKRKAKNSEPAKDTEMSG